MRGKWKKKKKSVTLSFFRLLLHTSSLELRSLSCRFFVPPYFKARRRPSQSRLSKNLTVPAETTKSKIAYDARIFSIWTYTSSNCPRIYEYNVSKFENRARRFTRMVHFWYNVIFSCVRNIKVNVVPLAQQRANWTQETELCARIKISCFPADGS